MLLTVDVGNTNTVLGVFRGKELVANWRLTTARDQTIDEYGILTRDLFTLAKLEPQEIGGVIISSVVPPLNSTLAGMAERYFNALEAPRGKHLIWFEYSGHWLQLEEPKKFCATLEEQLSTTRIETAK